MKTPKRYSKRTGKVEDGPVGWMFVEHNEGRKYTAEMGESVEGGTLKEDEFIETAENYINLIRAHINKENVLLFPMGDKMIPVDEQNNLIDEFGEFEEKVMGKGTHERLHGFFIILKKNILKHNHIRNTKQL